MAGELPERIPLFPLPNAVLFPGMPLPLHVFEPRYRKMVGDALKGPRIIGMVLLRSGFEADYEGRPPIYPIGCAGRMDRCDSLPDGRFNIVLRGLRRFQVLDEHLGAPYRIASVRELDDPSGDVEALQAARPKLLAAIGRASDGPAVLVMQNDLPAEGFVNALCQSLDLEPLERQSLLDCDSVSERCDRLIEILEWKAAEQAHGGRGGVH
ncbi:MAG TPA: LON peptidase substrate-binding domain-containing protein [Solirubrobacterales bacterium]|nr:LON peptidase substrate-binding domain-containing protein [Solirubrobacterales bacterium]